LFFTVEPSMYFRLLHFVAMCSLCLVPGGHIVNHLSL
jgi:hypothetical protein